MLTSISLANAGILWAAVFIPLLVMAYLKTKKHKSLVVSSVLILRSLKQNAAVRSRVHFPWRFYLELLILALLLFAAALPTRPRPTQTIALVVDNSLSMMATGRSGARRLDDALDAAKKALSDFSSNVRIVIYSTSPKMSPLNPKPVLPSEAMELLDKLKVNESLRSYSGDNLVGELKTVGESGRFTSVVVFADENLEFLNPSDDERKNKRDNVTTEVRGVKIGHTVENFYIANLRQSSEGVATDERTIIASVGWSALAAQSISIGLEATDIQSGTKTLLKKENLNLSPNKTTDISFAVPQSEKRRLELFLEAAKTVENAITVDDRAWVAPQDAKLSSVLLVSDDPQAGVLGLDSISSLRFERETSMKFASLDEKKIANYSLTVFHKSSPKNSTGIPSLLVLPPDDNLFFPVQKTVEAAQITSWKEQHPLTSYLRVPLLPVSRSLVFEVPIWGEAVINIEQGPVVVSGESMGVRYVAVGTEIFPFEGEKTPAQSVLTINVLNWLLGSGGSVGNSFVTGATYSLDKRKEWRVTAPQEKTTYVKRENLQDYELAFEVPGIYKFEDDTGSEPYEVAVNCFHPEESSTAVSRNVVLPRIFESQVNTKQEEEPFWPRVLKLVIAMLLIDWSIRLFWRKGHDSK